MGQIRIPSTAACARSWIYSCASCTFMSKTCWFVLTHFYFLLSCNSWYKCGFPSKLRVYSRVSWPVLAKNTCTTSFQTKTTTRLYCRLVKCVTLEHKDFCEKPRVWATYSPDVSTEWSTYKLLPCSLSFPIFLQYRLLMCDRISSLPHRNWLPLPLITRTTT